MSRRAPNNKEMYAVSTSSSLHHSLYSWLPAPQFHVAAIADAPGESLRTPHPANVFETLQSLKTEYAVCHNGEQ